MKKTFSSLLIFPLLLSIAGCKKNEPAPYDFDLAVKESGLPIIRIYTENSAEIASKEIWTNITSFTLTDPNNPEHNISRTGLDRKDRVRGRGNTTWNFPKKPYRIRFRENISFFGLPAAENWVLLAEYQDPTFLMNALVFDLGRNVFDHQPFTCSYRHVHVYLNGKYNGLYGLTEHRQADPLGAGAPGRAKINFETGWFVELSSQWDEDPKCRTENYDIPIMIKAPEAPTNAANSNNPFYDFIKNDWKQLSDLMASENFPENGYRDLIDMNTFVDFLMINEIVTNVELYYLNSVFSYKNTDGKICMGMLWDFDAAFGLVDNSVYFTDFAWWGKGAVDVMHQRLPMHNFLARFFEDPVFVEAYKNRWNEKHGILVPHIRNFLNTQGEKIRKGVEADAKKWTMVNRYDTNHARQVQLMTTWLERRISWLNTAINSTAN